MNSRQEVMELDDVTRRSAPGDLTKLKHGFVHYQLLGSDTAELILFIHGGGVTGMEVWNMNIPFFVEKGYQVLSYDLYGRGYSDRPKTENSPQLFQQQLNELLETNQVDRPITIVALSMGAIVAIDFLQNNPGRVKKIVLIDPAATGDYKPSPVLKLPVASNFVMTMVWYPRAVENQRKEFVNQLLFDKYAERLRFFMNFEGYKFTNYSTWMNMLNQNRIGDLRQLEGTPILLIYGNQDPYFSSSHAKRYRVALPKVKVIQIQEAGHMPNYEQPVEVNSAIYSFLRAAGTE